MVLWIGPSVGAYYFYWQARRKSLRCEHMDLSLWSLKQFIQITRLEHLGLILLLIGGFGRMIAGGWVLSESPWLQYKLAVFFILYIPMEVVDVYFVEWKLRRSLKLGDTAGLTRLITNYNRFLLVSIPFLLGGLPLIFIFAIFKP